MSNKILKTPSPISGSNCKTFFQVRLLDVVQIRVRVSSNQLPVFKVFWEVCVPGARRITQEFQGIFSPDQISSLSLLYFLLHYKLRGSRQLPPNPGMRH